MKPANSPGRKLERQQGALARFRKGPSQASLPRLNPLTATSRRREAINPITEVIRKAEHARLIELCAIGETSMVRRLKTKKDRTSRAKLGRNG